MRNRAVIVNITALNEWNLNKCVTGFKIQFKRTQGNCRRENKNGMETSPSTFSFLRGASLALILLTIALLGWQRYGMNRVYVLD
ncbi:MAG TPA: hypothetical protein VK832_19430, partial [Burkholderiaceae bacterium]|nr:hypothetical protein [Burkholderiaceae bacterium]